MDKLFSQYNQLQAENKQFSEETERRLHRNDQLTAEITELWTAIENNRISAKAEVEKRLSHIKRQYPSTCCLMVRLVAGWICLCAGIIAYDRGQKLNSSFYKLVGIALTVVGIGLILWGLPCRRDRAIREHHDRIIRDLKYENGELETLVSMQEEQANLLESISALQHQHTDVLLEQIRVGKLLVAGLGGGGSRKLEEEKKPTLKQVQVHTPPRSDSSEGS